MDKKNKNAKSAKKYLESESNEWNIYSNKKGTVEDTEMNVILPMNDPFKDIDIFMEQIEKEDAEKK